MTIVKALTVLQGLQCSWGPTTCTEEPAPVTDLTIRRNVGEGLRFLSSRPHSTNDDLQIAVTNYSPPGMDALKVLEGWYNSDKGVWDTTGWWNSANCLQVIADYCSVDRRLVDDHIGMFNNTLIQAPRVNLGEIKIRQQGRVQTVKARDVPPPNGFLNGFYDDEGWWALAWIRVFDVTYDPRYLQTSAFIYEDMKAGGSPCGGIWWDKSHSSQVAIANELFLSVAASLANRADALNDTSRNKAYYHDTALKQWDWFLQSGLVNGDGLVNDGLDNDTCTNNHETVFTYNQGVVLGALVELYRAAPNPSYINFALSIAHSAIDHLSDENGILTEPCDRTGYCDVTGAQFKGVFIRNLPPLYYASADAKIKEFVQRNAASILANDTNDKGQMGAHWAGPIDDEPNASTHSSAMDALVAAVAIE